jgi:hypothetical protein
VCGRTSFSRKQNGTAVSTLNGTTRHALASRQTQVDRFQQSKQGSANYGVNCRILPWIVQFEGSRRLLVTNDRATGVDSVHIGQRA